MRVAAWSARLRRVSVCEVSVAADLGFVHLHVHSSYSLLEGALPIARLAELAKADRQPALALTDTDNMFGALEFSEKLAGCGIQPIIGCALAIDFKDQDHGARQGPNAARDLPRLVHARHQRAGYRNLMRLGSRAFLETDVERAAAHSSGLARGLGRRSDRAHGRTGGTDRPRHPRRPDAPRHRSDRGAAGALRRPALCRDCSVTAPRRSAPPRRR